MADLPQTDVVTMDKIVSLARRRGFVFPSSEMAGFRRQWPVRPSFEYGGINYGVVQRPASLDEASGNGRV